MKMEYLKHSTSETVFVQEYRYPSKDWKVVHSQPCTEVGSNWVRGLNDLDQAVFLRKQQGEEDKQAEFRIIAEVHTVHYFSVEEES